jgi:hypothetical protein
MPGSDHHRWLASPSEPQQRVVVAKELGVSIPIKQPIETQGHICYFIEQLFRYVTYTYKDDMEYK